MDQQKTGEFLRSLRKEKGLTQEQLAEKFYVSSRTVSRWETGSNMHDLGVLIELADYYDVDIREIIDVERKNGDMDKETKDTLKAAAAYAEDKQKKRDARSSIMTSIAYSIMIINYAALTNGQYRGSLRGIWSEGACDALNVLFNAIAVILFCIVFMEHTPLPEKLRKWREGKRN